MVKLALGSRGFRVSKTLWLQEVALTLGKGDRRAWHVTVQGVAKCQTQLRDFHFLLLETYATGIFTSYSLQHPGAIEQHYCITS